MEDGPALYRGCLRYLRVTQEGQQWIANLYANVFSMEHRGQLLKKKIATKFKFVCNKVVNRSAAERSRHFAFVSQST